MNIPTVLITTTINEFKAEGYNCDGLNVTSSDNKETETQYISITFKKEVNK